MARNQTGSCSPRRRDFGRLSFSSLMFHITRPSVFLMVSLFIIYTNGKHHHLQSSSSSSAVGFPHRPVYFPDQGRIIISDDEGTNEPEALGPFVGNIVEESTIERPPPHSPSRPKRNCGDRSPSIAQRGLVGPTLKRRKRSYFAYTQEELDEQLKKEEHRQKREIAQAPLPWTCETKYEWIDMGPHNFPRFVRTAECKSSSCFNGFFRCRPRRYKTKVLNQIQSTDSTSCEEDDVSLPETLRPNFRFRTVEINLCCECGGRIPGTATE